MRTTIQKQSTIFLFLLLAVYGSTTAQQTFQWGVKAGGGNTDIINDITSIGNDIYITGRFTGSFNSGNQNIEGIANTDIYLARLNQKGSTKWLRSLAGEGFNNATRITTTEKNILLGGTISENVKQGKKQFPGDGKAVFISSWTEQGKTEWLTRLTYSGHATLDVLEVNPDGSLLAGGLLQGTMDIDGKELSSPKAKRAYTVTFSVRGKPMEANLSTGEGSHRLVSAAFDKKGNQYQLYSVTGNFSKQKDSVIYIPKSARGALILSKSGQLGKTEWIKTITGQGYIEGIKVVPNKNGQVLICSNYNKEITTGDTILTTTAQLETALFCYNGSGTLQWAKTISSPVKARTMDALITGNGNILVSGYFRQSYTFNQEEFFSESSGGNLFLLQFNAKGNMVWHDEPGQDAANFCKGFTLDQTGNIIFAGGFSGELYLQDKKLKSTGKEDILVAKYFNCLQKEAVITGNEPLCEGGTNTLSVSGDFTTYLWNDETWGEKEFTVTEPGTYFVTAFDKKGCAAADTVLIEQTGTLELGLPESIDINPGEQILLMATEGFSSYTWEDGLQGATREVEYTPDMDSIRLNLIAESVEGCISTDSVMVHFKHSDYGFSGFNSIGKTWPNPVQDKLSWSANIKKPKKVTVTLTDDKSGLVSKEIIKRYIPGSVQTINMGGLASGKYLLTIKVEDEIYNQKIVKR